MAKEKYYKKQGFTLLEIITVLAIIVVLVALAAPQAAKYLDSSKKVTCTANCDTLHTEMLAEVLLSGEDYSAAGALAQLLNDTLASHGSSICPAGGKISTAGVYPNFTVECSIHGAKWGRNLFDAIEILDKLFSSDSSLGSQSGSSWNAALQAANSGSPLAVENEVIKNAFGSQALKYNNMYWYVWDLSINGKKTPVMFAGDKVGDHSNWSGMMVYVDGRMYRSANQAAGNKVDEATVITNSATSLESYIEWLTESQGFQPLP